MIYARKDETGNKSNEKRTRRPKNAKNTDDGNWSEDQREKSYYYDDSYGYEIYNPDEDEDENDAPETAKNELFKWNLTKL